MLEPAYDREVDLLVAGAGAGGMAAALVAALEGLEVLLCEKSEQVGGTASTSAGTLWIPGNHQSRAAGSDDSAEQAELYMDALVGGQTNRHLRTAFLRTGPELGFARAVTRSDGQCGSWRPAGDEQETVDQAGRDILRGPASR